MRAIRTWIAIWAATSAILVAACNGNNSDDDDSGAGGTTGGETTGGGTTGGETTGGGTTGGGTTGGETTGGGTTGGGTTGGGTGVGSARDCFNPQQATIGTRINQVIRSTDSASGITLTTTSDTLVNRATSYNGHDAIESVSDVDADASNPLYSSTSTTKSYYAVNAGAFTSQAFGTVTEVHTPISGTLSTTINPPREDRYDLDPGESYTQTYTVSTSGAPVAIPDTTSTVKRTYVGRESVTVPAGTFEACRFEEDVTVGSTTTTTTMWFDVGSGIELKVDAGDISETVSASINGSPID